MQLPTWLGHVIKSGEVTLFTGDVEAVQVKAGDNRLDINATNKEFLKDVIGSVTSIGSKLAHLKSIAGELKADGLTVTLSFQGDRLVTIGLEAKPKLSRLVTGTNAVEINNLRKLLELSL
ncbi:hypothetical protein G4O51_08285 [Candidatus Bathyarchaeota archaeon A05DMB-2]|nr:hypothetical protein [Candidatus Bathyarchaeota archaeon A05DMB-2]